MERQVTSEWTLTLEQFLRALQIRYGVSTPVRLANFKLVGGEARPPSGVQSMTFEYVVGSKDVSLIRGTDVAHEQRTRITHTGQEVLAIIGGLFKSHGPVEVTFLFREDDDRGGAAGIRGPWEITGMRVTLEHPAAP